MSRYNNSNPINNNSEIANKRGANSIRHHGVQIINHPSIRDRMELLSTSYIWSNRDRLYNLSYQYYGDPRYWWVIAWFNGKPTEADFYAGETIEIPLNIEKALEIFES